MSVLASLFLNAVRGHKVTNVQFGRLPWLHRRLKDQQFQTRVYGVVCLWERTDTKWTGSHLSPLTSPVLVTLEYGCRKPQEDPRNHKELVLHCINTVLWLISETSIKLIDSQRN